MSVHEFLKNTGAMVIKVQEKKADEAREYIGRVLGSDDDAVDELKVEFDDDVVRLHGKCKSQKAMEKAILAAGNINGVSKVISDGLQIIGKSLKSAVGFSGRFYTIKKGDTLSGISKQFYGDAGKYMDIVRENKGIIKDPDSIYPGQVIRIPEL